MVQHFIRIMRLSRSRPSRLLVLTLTLLLVAGAAVPSRPARAASGIIGPYHLQQMACNAGQLYVRQPILKASSWYGGSSGYQNVAYQAQLLKYTGSGWAYVTAGPLLSGHAGLSTWSSLGDSWFHIYQPGYYAVRLVMQWYDAQWRLVGQELRFASTDGVSLGSDGQLREFCRYI